MMKSHGFVDRRTPVDPVARGDRALLEIEIPGQGFLRAIGFDGLRDLMDSVTINARDDAKYARAAEHIATLINSKLKTEGQIRDRLRGIYQQHKEAPLRLGRQLEARALELHWALGEAELAGQIEGAIGTAVTCGDPSCAHDGCFRVRREEGIENFDYGHLPPNLQAVSRPFRELAEHIVTLPPGVQRALALQDLVKAKDAAVRAARTSKDR